MTIVWLILSDEAVKHILILTGRFGMGHCCAAEAIRQQLSTVNPYADVHVVDLIDYLFPRQSEAIYRAFSHLVNHFSTVYNSLNRMVGRCGILPIHTMMMYKIRSLLRDDQADIVISTLPLCSQYISAYKQQCDDAIPLYTYITDIGAQDEWIVPHTNAYFVGAYETKIQLMQKGVRADRIHICGIPVRQDFLRPMEQRSHSEKTELLLMGGGLGLIPSSDAFLSALSQRDDLHLTVIAGKNHALHTHLCAQYPSIHVVGYTDQVARYMRSADLLITKSGGITTFEAIRCGTPLYVIRPFLMQEIGNAHYIEQHDIGRVIWSRSGDVASDILTLLQNNEHLAMMKRSMADICAQLEPLCPAIYFGEEAVL